MFNQYYVKVRKNSIYFTSAMLFSLVMFTMFACGGKEKANDTADKRLGKLEVEIPAELEENEEIVAYIEGMNEVADQYAILMDDMLEEVGDLSGKEPEELSMMEQLRLVKATGEVTVRSAEIMSRWSEYIDQRDSLNEQLSEEELQALEAVYTRFEQRMTQIMEKHEDLFTEETES